MDGWNIGSLLRWPIFRSRCSGSVDVLDPFSTQVSFFRTPRGGFLGTKSPSCHRNPPERLLSTFYGWAFCTGRNLAQLAEAGCYKQVVTVRDVELQMYKFSKVKFVFSLHDLSRLFRLYQILDAFLDVTWGGHFFNHFLLFHLSITNFSWDRIPTEVLLVSVCCDSSY